MVPFSYAMSPWSWLCTIVWCTSAIGDVHLRLFPARFLNNLYWKPLTTYPIIHTHCWRVELWTKIVYVVFEDYLTKLVFGSARNLWRDNSVEERWLLFVYFWFGSQEEDAKCVRKVSFLKIDNADECFDLTKYFFVYYICHKSSKFDSKDASSKAWTVKNGLECFYCVFYFGPLRTARHRE